MLATELTSLLGQLIERCTGTQRSWVQIPYRSECFSSGLLFTNAQVVFITAKISFILTSFSAVQIYDFHIFTVVYSLLYGFIWNQHNDQLPFGRALHRYRRGHGFKSRTGLNLFPALFSLLLKYCSLLRRSLS